MVVEPVTGQFSRWNKKISGKVFGDFGFLSANTRLGGLVFSGTWCRGLFFTVGGWSHGSAGRPAWSLPGGEYMPYGISLTHVLRKPRRVPDEPRPGSANDIRNEWIRRGRQRRITRVLAQLLFQLFDPLFRLLQLEDQSLTSLSVRST